MSAVTVSRERWGTRFGPGLVGWMLVIPFLTAAGVATGGTVEVVFGMVIFAVAKVVLQTRDFGVSWTLVTNLCALAIAISSFFGGWAYVAWRGEEVRARVVAGTGGPGGHNPRLRDPKTDEDLGSLLGKPARNPPGSATPRGRDNTVLVRVLRGSDRPALTADRVDTGKKAAAAWMLSWIAGFGLSVYSTLRRRREARPG